MPIASNIFRSFFYSKGVELTVEKHCSKYSGDIGLLQGEKRRIYNLGAKNMKYQIPELAEHYIEETKQKIESLISKLNVK